MTFSADGMALENYLELFSYGTRPRGSASVDAEHAKIVSRQIDIVFS